MEPRAERAQLLVAVGEGRAATLLEEVLERIATLCKRYSDQGRFAEVDDYAEWGKALTHAEELERWLRALVDTRQERDGQAPAWLVELHDEIERMERGERLPADRDPIRLRAGLILASQKIARLGSRVDGHEIGEGFDDEVVRLGGADAMREIMARVDRGEQPVG